MEILYCTGLDRNIFWVIKPHHEERSVICVDPGDFSIVNDFLVKNGFELSSILLTHRHGDHWGGIEQLKQVWNCVTLGPQHEHLHFVDRCLDHGDVIMLGTYAFHCFSTPGHTDEHISFFFAGNSEEQPALFSGDIVFRAGCGRAFDSHPGILWKTIRGIKRLPPDTRIFYAHDYTCDNLEFVNEIDPFNLEASRLSEVVRRESSIKPTSVAHESLVNPFFRCDDPLFIEMMSNYFKINIRNSIQCFSLIRHHKNNWKSAGQTIEKVV